MTNPPTEAGLVLLAVILGLNLLLLLHGGRTNETVAAARYVNLLVRLVRR